MNLASVISRETMTRHWRWGLPLAAGIVAVDQITKTLVLADARFNALACLDRSAPCGGFPVIGPVLNDSPLFSLSMVWNRGVSFGALQAEGAGRWLLVLMTTAIAVGFAIWLLRASRPITALALSLVIGGAVGNNLIDRARFGAVVDFLDFSGLYFPWVFNIADAAITIGAGLLLLDQLLASRDAKR
jgi:signal peptidase II